MIFGGRSAEHEVSLVSAASVIQALDKEKYEIVPIGITPEGRWLSSEDAVRLLKEKAGMISADELVKSEKLLHKALALYLKGFMNVGYTETDLNEYQNDIREIEVKLEGSLSGMERQSLSQFHEKVKRNENREDC